MGQQPDEYMTIQLLRINYLHYHQMLNGYDLHLTLLVLLSSLHL